LRRSPRTRERQIDTAQDDLPVLRLRFWHRTRTALSTLRGPRGCQISITRSPASDPLCRPWPTIRQRQFHIALGLCLGLGDEALEVVHEQGGRVRSQCLRVHNRRGPVPEQDGVLAAAIAPLHSEH
jgi:hypothetical protein